MHTYLAIFCTSIWVFCLYSTDVQAATPAISAGGRHTIGLSTDGAVRAWGDDAIGQLGIGRQVQYVSPTLSGISGVKVVLAGYYHTVAQKVDGSVWAWGHNDYGQLGDGTRTDRSAPVLVNGLTSVAAISAGGNHTVALKVDGSVWAWGMNNVGQLGDGTTTSRTSPVAVSGLTSVVAISAGYRYTVARKADGSVWAWGNNNFGQLGDGTKIDQVKPVKVSGLTSVAAISAGGEHAVALKGDGSVWAWGRNNSGQLGDGTTADRLIPFLAIGLTGVETISAGGYHTVVRKGDGSVWTWGDNSYGQLGNGTKVGRSMPVVVSGLTGVTTISAGGFHTIAQKGDGSVWTWGINAYGQVGNGTTTDQSIPFQVNGFTGAAGIAAGLAHTVALKGDGSVWAWGANTYGQLGNGATTYRSTPAVILNGLTGVAAISAGANHAVALKADGSVWGWGDNYYGELGDGSVKNSRSTPVKVSALSGVVAIATGEYHTLALKSDGYVWAWGRNNSGQLGDLGTADRSNPERVIGLGGVIAIAAGGSHSVALKSDGTVSAWGENDQGELGDGTTNGRTYPSLVIGLTGVVAVSAGLNHTVALKGDGSVWAWGINSSAQLGDGTTNNQLIPVKVSGLNGVTAISAGYYHTVARKGDDSVWAWGANSYGQLGDGTTTNRSTPSFVRGLAGLAAISAGGHHTVALKNDGSSLAWGGNYVGQLGDGTLADRRVPVVVVRENGSGSVAANNWFLDMNPALVKAIPTDKIPVFPVVATQEANDITANIQFRAADVGTKPNVYIFALAPTNLVKNVSAEAVKNHKGPVTRSTNTADTPLPCVPAQLTGDGQLTAVVGGVLQAVSNLVRTSQGATVSVLKGVNAALMKGSVIYVGIGSESNLAAMINNVIQQSVVTVPGDRTCQPQAPQTGWWWNPAEPGRGFGIEVRGNNLFMSGYLYDNTGHATWVVSPGPVALDGSLFNGALLQVANGQTLNGNYKVPSPATSPGAITLSFTNARAGTLTWPGGTIPIVRFDDSIGDSYGGTPSFVPENGWWWNEAESGRGFFMEFMKNYAFIAGYMYENDGRPVWYLTQKPMTTPQRFQSVWQQVANGQTLTGPYKPASVSNFDLGAVTIQFQDAANAILTLPNGKPLAITRHRF